MTWDSGKQDETFTIFFEGDHCKDGHFRGSCELERVRERSWHFQGQGRIVGQDGEPYGAAIEAQLQLVAGWGGTKLLTGTWLDEDDDRPYTLRVEIDDR